MFQVGTKFRDAELASETSLSATAITNRRNPHLCSPVQNCLRPTKQNEAEIRQKTNTAAAAAAAEAIKRNLARV
jgi:hypothetical protein